jgi:7,8-dihydropterin-6-yl-methyl-4-(beta-D-ribofuranosyl)aminobenzene 5'-phosphate synthase
MLDSQPPEQAMVVDTGGITATVSGCAHPGMERVVDGAIHLLGKKVDWAIGGFHQMYANPTSIAASIRALQDLGVEYVVPTHCTGDAAKAAFTRAYGARCIDGGVGREVDIVRRQG